MIMFSNDDITTIKKMLYEKAVKYGFQDFNIDNPKTWCEKMAWLQLYDNVELRSKCADKIKVHEYCKEKLGEDICVPIIKIYDSVDDIDIDKLPEKFILKCNHGWANNIIVKDKSLFDLNESKNKITKWLSEPFGIKTLEFHYIDIKRKCYSEILLEEPQKNDVTDYKFLCFSGKPTYCQILNERYTKNFHLNYYDMDFNFVDICRCDVKNDINKLDEKPSGFELMKEYAKKLSEDFKFVRVDFYNIGNDVYLGEMTFTPAAGFIKWTNPNIDRMFGDEIKI